MELGMDTVKIKIVHLILPLKGNLCLKKTTLNIKTKSMCIRW